jgi:DtxR family Mn-dependent transcriptional regulator
VHDEACRLEHYISEEFADKINELLGDPSFDPHGHPIPKKDGTMPDSKEINLTQIEAGTKVIIKRLADNDAKLLAYLEESGLMPNTEIEVTEKAPFNGPVTVNYSRGKQNNWQ